MAIEAVGLIQPILQFSDEDGVPYAGGSVTFVQVGTSTAQNVYSDAALTTSLGNVITLNAAGRFSTSATGPDTAVYLQQKTYDYTLKDASGTTIYGPITVSGSQWPGQVQSTAILSPAANANGYTNRFATTINKASSGTHALFAGTRFDTPTIGAGASTLTESATVYIEGAPATGTSAYALHVAAGTVRFDGPFTFGSGFGTCNGRLTLTSGTPVTSADVTGATTVYFTPYQGNNVSLFDGVATWTLLSFSEISVALGTLTANLPYDLFIYNNSGTVAFRSPVAWTNTTTRATALTTQNGVLVKTGATTDRYLGTFYTDSTTVTSDAGAGAAASGRHLWNYYNRVARFLSRTESTASWTYATSTVRQANGSTANQVQVIQGVAEDAIDLSLTVTCANNNNLVSSAGIGVDSLTTYAVGQWQAGAAVSDLVARYNAIPAVGHHAYSWNEWSGGATSTFYSAFASAGSTMTGGLFGIWRC